MKVFILLLALSFQNLAGEIHQCTFDYFKEHLDSNTLELSDFDLAFIEAADRFHALKDNYPVHIEKDFTGKEYYQQIKYKKVLTVKDSIDDCGFKTTSKIIFEEECVYSDETSISQSACRAICKYIEGGLDPRCEF